MSKIPYKYALVTGAAKGIGRSIAGELASLGVINGNYGNMYFIWDVIFGTAHITRKYPEQYGLEEYHEEPWYVQLGYPIFKSKDERSEMSK